MHSTRLAELILSYGQRSSVASTQDAHIIGRLSTQSVCAECKLQAKSSNLMWCNSPLHRSSLLCPVLSSKQYLTFVIIDLHLKYRKKDKSHVQVRSTASITTISIHRHYHQQHPRHRGLNAVPHYVKITHMDIPACQYSCGFVKLFSTETAALRCLLAC
jgi:hypothetical protein